MIDPLSTDPVGAQHLHDTSAALLLDVREDDEWEAGHAPGAVHIRLAELDPATLDPARTVVAICRSGNRSGKAADRLARAGVVTYNMEGGMKLWKQQGYSVVRDDGSPGEVI